VSRQALERLGQEPYNQQSVFNFFHHDYQPEGAVAEVCPDLGD
jgi:hypothetical protein